MYVIIYLLNYRTTTPNSLREALKETLAQNVAKNNDGIAETIQQINDGEILDTFNEDVDVSPLNHHHNQHSLQNNNSLSTLHHYNKPEDRSDTVSLPGERSSSRRKFREVLGDRELMLKKKELSTQDLSNSNDRIQNGGKDEELGNGLFDRFSLARKTLDRNSIRLANILVKLSKILLKLN